MKLDKKLKYFIHALIITVLVFLFSATGNINFAIAAVILTFTGTFVSQYPNIRPQHIIINNLMPMHLIIGTLLSLNYFPNLGLPVKIAFILALGAGFYIVSLVNNVFLVVEEKEEPIPLFRVAVTWSQILFVVVTIPFFAGLFKLPSLPFVSSVIISISAFLFTLYTFWMLEFDPEAKKVRGAEALFWGLFSSFIVFAASMSVSFVPTESFLRALFVSSVLMFCLNYVYGYIKNHITKRLITEYLLITFVFFALMFIFKN